MRVRARGALGHQQRPGHKLISGGPREGGSGHPFLSPHFFDHLATLESNVLSGNSFSVHYAHEGDTGRPKNTKKTQAAPDKPISGVRRKRCCRPSSNTGNLKDPIAGLRVLRRGLSERRHSENFHRALTPRITSTTHISPPRYARVRQPSCMPCMPCRASARAPTSTPPRARTDAACLPALCCCCSCSSHLLRFLL